jgi:hypothetical protein
VKHYKKPKSLFRIVLLLFPALKKRQNKAKEGKTGTLFSSTVGRGKNVVYGTVTVVTKKGKKAEKGAAVCGERTGEHRRTTTRWRWQKRDFARSR